MFNKIFKSLSKTRDAIFGSVKNLIGINKKIDEDFLKSLERSLLLSDIGLTMTSEIINNLKAKNKSIKIETESDLKNIVFDSISSVFENVLKNNSPNQNQIQKKTQVILVVGINGVGKTTSIAKLAYKFSNQNKKVVIGSGDTFRAAANEQLNIWASRANVKIIQQNQGSDPASVAFDTINFAKSNNYDVAIIDTAGRLHTKSNLMDELKKIKRVISKIDSSSPDEILFVIDASCGQNGLQQAKEFNKAVGITGIIITKLDGTAKGGIILSILNELKIPIKYIGVGEQIDDLEEFNPVDFINSILPKGDL